MSKLIPPDDATKARFMAKVAVDPKTGCWLFEGHCNTVNGYGQFWHGKRVIGAHVFSYLAHHGAIPDGHEVGIKCHVHNCVHPDHIVAATRRENLLRGNTIPARKAAQTHCGQGHELAGANIYRGKSGTRQCRICKRESYRAWVEKNRDRRRELDRNHYARKVA